MKRGMLIGIALVCVVALVLSACGDSPADPTAKVQTSTPRDSASAPDVGEQDNWVCTVTHVFDGDTVLCDNGLHVRFIGIDCPENNTPWSGEAAWVTRQWTLYKQVRLEIDVAEIYDKYDRVLAYVWVGDQLVNYVLAREGLAKVYVNEFPAHQKWRPLLLDARRQAKAEGKGIWGPGPTAVPKLPPTAVPTEAPGNCDASYPSVCIPPSPPDLDCGDIPYRRFTVLSPDPHRFDGDFDGVGCESG